MAAIVDGLRSHRIVGIDTSIFIYHLEAHPNYGLPARLVLEGLVEGSFHGVTSILALMELVVKPLQDNRPEVADEYEILVANFPNLSISPFDRKVMRRAAELRARYRVRPADALHVASCLEHGATAFVTNDRDLRRIEECAVVLLEDLLAA